MSSDETKIEVDDTGALFWQLDDAGVAESNIGRYREWLQENYDLKFGDYQALWGWSVRDLDGFWGSIWRYFEIDATEPPTATLADAAMPGARWFPGATLNFAAHIFRSADQTRPALITITENDQTQQWSWAELRQRTGAFAAYLRGLGVGPGDRVVGYLPNIAETVVAFLATASLGAVWSVCNHDLAIDSVIERFQQLEPVVLVAADGSRFAERDHDRRPSITALRAALPTLRAAVVIPRLGLELPAEDGLVEWDEAIADQGELLFTPVPFDHPLWVLFSSGTTGAPKGILHGHGGILVEFYKSLILQGDIRPGDRYLCYTSTTWVMWNITVGTLLAGATTVLYDGSPTHPHTDRLWQIADTYGISLLTVGAAYLITCAQQNLRPAATHRLSALRSISSTGSPLPASAYSWIRDAVGSDLSVDSSSGGTDIAGAFVNSNPMLPVYAGEISGPCLGVAIEAWNDNGQPVVDQVGEMVITEPMPSMPVGFWNDPRGERYREAYFEHYPGVWRHGDWITITSRGSVVIHGRSDATLNRMGIRLGSAEIYRAVDALAEVREALVVGVELPDGGYWLPLFVHLEDNATLDDSLKKRIAEAIRDHASARHIPDDIIAVPGIPHTITGKKLEVPLKKILLGTPPENAVNLGAVDNPDLLEPYKKLGQANTGKHRTPLR